VETVVTNRRQEAAELLLRRREARRDLNEWARWNGFEPAQHHRLLNEELEKVVRGETRKLAIFMPPGSAKSTYASVLFPPWFLAQRKGAAILSCSHSYTLAERFGKRCRNLIDNNCKVLGYELARDSQAAGDWGTTNGGVYFAAGVGAGIAGHRADLGLIDDPIGSQEDADSQLVREKQADWYVNDFFPRLKPNASQVLIMNRRHEADLAGVLLKQGGWRVIKLPFFAKDKDVLGRLSGQRLWPEWFTPEMAEEIKKLPSRVQAGLYDQEPAPDSGNFFKRAWIQGYKPEELPQFLQTYAVSDHAVSLKQDNDCTCLMPFGVDNNSNIWIFPDIWWNKSGTDGVVEEMINIMQRRKPLLWWAEEELIKKSIGPFLRKRMIERKVYCTIEGIVSARDKRTRAHSFKDRMSMGMVFFPTFAHWWPLAEHEMMMFDAGDHDDFVDCLSLIGRMLDRLVSKAPPVKQQLTDPRTFRWVKEQQESEKRRMAALQLDY
jgi:predicted phage terminase large subunit-like protein